MREEKFDMMVNILKILEKKNDPRLTESILEIVDDYDERLTPEQKARILDNFLKYRGSPRKAIDEKEHKKHFEEALQREQSRLLVEPDFSLY